MGLRLVTAPLTTAISLVEAKAHLRVDDSDEDALITSYIEAATDYAEKFLGRALIDQTWDLYLDAFPTGTDTEIKIPKPPLIEVTGVFYNNTGGSEAAVDPGDYYVDSASEPGWIVPQGGATWPATLDAINAVRIRYRAGYLNGDSPPSANVPSSIRSALLLTIGAFFENREQTVVGTIANRLPWGVDELLRKYRVEISMA